MIRLYLFILCLIPALAHAVTVEVTLQENQFSPSTITLPADEASVLRIRNVDVAEEILAIENTPVEAVLKPSARTKVELPALAAGHYQLIGKMNPDTAKATLVVN